MAKPIKQTFDNLKDLKTGVEVAGAALRNKEKVEENIQNLPVASAVLSFILGFAVTGFLLRR